MSELPPCTCEIVCAGGPGEYRCLDRSCPRHGDFIDPVTGAVLPPTPLDPGCLHCGARPAPHVVFGDPLCDECNVSFTVYDAHRAEGGGTEGPAYLTDLDAAGQEIGALAYWLSEVVRLDDEVDDLTAGAMREEIRRIAEQVRGRESVQRAGEVTR